MAFLTRFSGFPGVSGVGFIRCRWAVYMSCDCACQVQAQMAYNGLAYKSGLRQRMTMTAYSSGLSVTTQYTPDPTARSRTLAATADGQTSFYLYGLGPLGEFTNAWSYSLPDGTGTPRQLTDAAGAVTLANRYDPWGEILQQAGQGNFTWGYFGGLMDAATGLIYVGEGQYYDPQTGRFLTRGAQPSKANPYVPWGGEPTGLLIGPLALMVLLRWKKRSRALGRIERVLLAALVVVAVGVVVAGCGGDSSATPPPTTKSPPTTEPPSQPTGGPSTSQTPPIQTSDAQTTPSTAIPTLGTLTPTITCTSTPTPTPILLAGRLPTSWEQQYGQAIALAAHNLLATADQYYVWGTVDHPDEDNGWPPPREVPTDDSVWGYNNSINVKDRTGGRIPIVCADVVDLAYKDGGLDLEATFPEWLEGYPNDPRRNSIALEKLIGEKGKLNQFDNGAIPELGDMIFFSDGSHTGVIAEILGSDVSQIFVIQASYSQGVINKMSVADWQDGETPVSFGHPTR